VDWLIELQRWLYGGMAETMGVATDASGLPMLMGLAFVFGIVQTSITGTSTRIDTLMTDASCFGLSRHNAAQPVAA
jgi:hypothetical protein